MRILIVEDDRLLGEGILAGLRQTGFQSDWVQDGERALAALRIEPFSAVVLDLGELAARLRALIRRSNGSVVSVIEHGDLRLDPAARTATLQGQQVELASREFDLLHELLLGTGRVLTRVQLESRLYPWGEEIGSNAIEVHVHHLRKKISPELIRTVRGIGYMIERP